MPDKPFSKPLELSIGDNTLRFSSMPDFVFSMDSRTAITVAKLSDLFELSIEELNSESKTIAQLNKKLFSILTTAIDDPDSINRAIRELDPLVFSQDHNWRDIIKALHDGDDEYNALRTTALSKYMKYLSALEETIGLICNAKQRSPGTRAEVTGNPELGETWSIEQMRSVAGAELPIPGEYEQLPKDEKVVYRLMPGKRLDIRLASHQCQLVATESNVQFIDHSGVRVLHKGNNIVGRSSKSNIKIDAARKDVSRSHLLIQINDDNTLQLQDISSQGNSVAIAAHC